MDGDFISSVGGKVDWELLTQPLASKPADDKPFLGVAQIPLRPVDRATVNELQSTTGRSRRVDMKAEINVVSSAVRSLVIDCTFKVLELRSNRCEKLSIENVVAHSPIEIRD